jgi:hypothetical protein
MRVAAVITDLMTYSRIEAAAAAAGGSAVRVDSPAQLPRATELDLVVVDWADRQDGWAESLAAWHSTEAAARLILFGPHVDLDAHADAKAAGLGPMWARSRLVRELPALLHSS